MTQEVVQVAALWVTWTIGLRSSMLPPSLVCGRQIGAAYFASRTCT